MSQPGVVFSALAPIAALQDAILIAFKHDSVIHIDRFQGTELISHQQGVRTVAHWRRKQAESWKGEAETHHSKGQTSLGFTNKSENEKYNCIFCLFSTLHSLWDLSSPTRDWTQALSSDSAEF